MKNAYLVCISSPLGRTNFYSTLLNAKHPKTGESVFLTYHAKLACKKCLKTEHPENCEHCKDIYPPWKSQEKQEIAKIFLQNKMGIVRRELLGIITESANSLISIRVIDAFKEKPLKSYDLIVSCRQVLITCDPNCGGSNEFSLVATTYISGQIVIMGLDSHPCHSVDDTEVFFERFIDGLKKHPWLSSALFIFVAERNSGRESAHLARAFLRRYKNRFAIRQKDENDFGWWTDYHTKLFYAESTRLVLNKCSVFFSDGWISTNPWIRDDETRRSTVHAKFFDQLARYQVHEKPITSMSSSSAPKVFISGKVNDEGKIQEGQNDDLCFTFTMNIGMWDYILQRLIPGFPYDQIHLG